MVRQGDAGLRVGGEAVTISIPTGLCHSAQGWSEATTLGKGNISRPTLKGLCQKSIVFYNPFRVESLSIAEPKVARSSQPWAEGWNPFGILQMEFGGSL